MGSATQVYYSAFDRAFLELPSGVRDRIQAEIDDLGRRLSGFPHHRLVGSERYRLRVGDYRVIYTFDSKLNEIYLYSVGHRREIYR